MSKDTNQPQYEAPLLGYQEIYDVLNELQIPANEIKNPSPQFVKKVYGKFMERIFDKSQDELTMPSMEATDILESPELHDQSITEFEFKKNLKFLFESIGINDFSPISDLLTPETKRFRHHLSALINFARFRQKRIDKYEELSVESEKLVIKKDNLVEQHEDLLTKVQKIRTTKEAEKPEIEYLEKYMKDMSIKIQQLNSEQMQLSEINKELKTKNGEIEDKIQVDKENLDITQKECKLLRSQIVQNPEQLRMKISNLSQSVEELKSSVSKVEDKNSKSENLLKEKRQQIKDITNCETLVNEIESQYASHLQIKEENKNLKNSNKRVLEDIEELKTYQSHMNRQIQSQQEKFEHLRKQQEEKRAINEELRKDISREKSVLDKNREDYLIRLDYNKQSIIEMERNIENLKELHEQRMNEIYSRIVQLGNGMREYHQEITNKLSK
eukprot:gene3150-5466_t